MAYDFRLLDWEQSIKLIGTAHYEQRDFVGAAPFIVATNSKFNVLSQSGFAIGLKAITEAPPPLFPDALAQPKEVEYTQIDSSSWKTAWNYLMFVATDYNPDLATLQATPTAPTFRTAPT